MPADLITSAHLSVSSAMSLPKSAGEPASTVTPALNRGKGRIDLADSRGVENLDLQPDGGGGFLHDP